MSPALRFTTAALSAFCFAVPLMAQAATCPENDPAVTATMVEMYEAAKTDDINRFHEVTTPDFYTYDGGRVFKGDTLMTLLKTKHASGVKWEWSVTDPQVHATCDTAWITYTNVGAMIDDKGRQPLTWVESATLIKTDGQWRIRFFHSTRVPKPES